MYPVSPDYAYFLKRYAREFSVKAVIAGVEYDNTVIVDFSIDNSLTLSNGFEIGTAIPSKLTITLRTQDTIPPNAKVVPYLGLSSETLTWLEAIYPWNQTGVPWAGGVSEWLPLGEFYVDKREKNNSVWTFTCYDKLVFSDVAYISSLTYPTTQQAVWDEICTSLGYTYDSSVVINPGYIVQVGPTGYTKRQVLAYISGANSASVYVSKDGTIKFKRFSADEEPVFDMGTGDYIRVKQTNPVKTYTRVVVTYNPDDGLTYEAGTGDENHTLYTVNPFATQAITNDLLSRLNGFTYLPLNMDARGFPQLEQGDTIQFAHAESSSWLDTVTAWNDTEIPWTGEVYYKTIILHQSFSFRGGLRMRIESPSISEQQSEFAVDGSLTTQVNNLNKVAVRENRNYFGVTITRQDGIIVEREDHASKAIFNSDELTFYRGTEKAIYFDTANNVYKFNGTLEAADGVFSGSLQAASGTFTGTIQGGSFVGGTIAIGSGNNIFKADSNGIYLGHATFASAPFRVNMAGQMTATSGAFTGSITSSTIVGGTITGSTIQTSAPGIYPRGEMNSTDNAFKVEYGVANSIEIRPDVITGVPIIRFDHGIVAGQIAALTTSAGGIDAIQMQSLLSHIRLKSALNLILEAGGSVLVDSWSKLKSDGASQTLQQVIDFLQSQINSKAPSFTGLNGGTPAGASLIFSNGVCVGWV